MLFEHLELFDRFSSNLEIQSCSHSLQPEELRSKMILYIASGVGYFLTNFAFWFLDLEQGLIIIRVSDLEENEFDIVNVVFWLAKEVFGGFLECSCLFDCECRVHYLILYQIKYHLCSNSLWRCRVSSLNFLISSSFDWRSPCILRLISLILASDSPNFV